MEAYTAFADVYDLFMDNIDYPQWADYLEGLLKKQGVSGGLVLDLGCGTGTMTELLARAGYDMIGVDSSAEMLELAREKQLAQAEERAGEEAFRESGEAGEGRSAGREADILYLLQDMREFELYGTVAAVVSCCDSLNYILEEEELLQVFRLVNNYLDPGGIFLFDLNTEYKYREILGEATIAENREEASFIWENYYDEASRINEYAVTLFLRERDGRYAKREEFHYQRAWRREEVERLLAEAGLELTAVYEAFTTGEPGAGTERLQFVAREIEKKRPDKAEKEQRRTAERAGRQKGYE